MTPARNRVRTAWPLPGRIATAWPLPARLAGPAGAAAFAVAVLWGWR